MECWWANSVRFFKVLGSYIIALLRLVLWTFIFFFTGLQRTLFMRSEITGVDFTIVPLRCDMEDASSKLSYIDKLCLENPDLTGMENEIPFDDIMLENDENPDEGFGDNGENLL